MPIEILGRKVGNIGYGMLGLTTRPKPLSDEQSFATMRAALDANCCFWNGGEFYGPPDNNSLTLLKKYYEKYPEDVDRVVLNIKGGLKPDLEPDGSPEFVKNSVAHCLEMLGGKGRIDIFECARIDPSVPLARTLGTLAELVDEGKIGGVAISEVGANTIREASKITKILAVEVELSLWSTDPLTNGVAEVCAELKIPILAYSPIGRGMLTGQIKSYGDIPEGDFRRHMPRFQPENFDVNLKLVRELEKIAKNRDCTAAQLALGWLLTLSKRDGMPEIIPIPGSSTADRVVENSVELELTTEEMKEIDSILSRFDVSGDRYHAGAMKFVNG